MHDRFASGRGSALHKVSMVLMGLVLAALLFATYNYMLYQRITEQYLQSEQGYFDGVQIKEEIKQCDVSMKDYLLTGNRARLAEYNGGIQQITERLTGMHQKTNTPQVKSILQSIQDAFYSYQSYSNYAAFYQTQGQLAQSGDNQQKAHPIGEYIQRYCDDLLICSLEGNRSYYENQQSSQSMVLLLNLTLVTALSGGALLALLYLNDAFNRPLFQLYRAAQEISKGDFSHRVPEECSEEMLHTVLVAFNGMTASVMDMMEDVKHTADIEKQLLSEQLKNNEYSRLLEQANFMALQSQTNPHFMFNTLNSISRTVTLGRGDAAVNMIDALAELLRYNLQDAGQPVRLAEEIGIVQKYILIQEYRFGSRIRVVYEVDTALAMQVRLPRFTLQPIVENAIIHGLEPKAEGGTITLRVRKEGENCIVTIADDGLGIPQGRLQKLMAGISMVRQGHTTSIGIHNTVKRLELFCHKADVLTIVSVVNQGTAAQIRLPL